MKTVEFSFVGIFDTVSSVGIINPGLWNGGMGKVLRTVERVTPATSDFHEDNKRDLGLDSLVYDENVKSIVHICALDEYRENFALQVLPCSNKVEQFFIPGIHTDIGGGDLEGYAEEKLIPKRYKGKKLYISKVVTPGKKKKKDELLEVTVSNFEELGWVKADREDMMADIVEENDEIIKLQKYVKRGYTYIPLNIMAEKAKKHTCSFDTIKNKYSISGKDEKGKKVLPSNFDEMKTIWKGSESVYGHCYYPKEEDKYKILRQRWLHFSSSINKTVGLAIVNGPNITDSSDKPDDSKVPYYDRFLDYHPHPKGWYGKVTELGIKDIVFEEAGNQNDDNYLGEAVIIFDSKNEEYTIVKTEKGEYKFITKPSITIDKGKECYIRWVKNKDKTEPNDPDWIESKEIITEIKDGVPAIVTIYGKANNKDDAHNKIERDFAVGMTIPSVNGSATLSNGNYYAYKRQMDTKDKAYRNDAYLIVKNRKDESNDGLKNKNSFIDNMTLLGIRDGKEEPMTGVYLHRTDKDGNATSSSEGCLLIDGRYWEKVNNLLGNSQDVFIRLNRT